MSEIPARLKSAIADRYVIEWELGQGGMATVYLAQDVRHDRKVALKVLRPELAAVIGADRFLQEIKVTANLQHPHILALHDSGEAAGFLYYVMPYIAGETLRDKLNREKQLRIEEAVRITCEVAEALDYAHRQEVIHRDIKPENILLHDGRPLVADFGIALAVSAAAGGRMTETGLSLGTPHYMSPEQATAEKDITGRSDIYSLGVVLYEMLTGSPPHVGSAAQQIISKIITEEPMPVTRARKSVPSNVAAAVSKALEKLPADRFASALGLGEALANPRFSTTTVPAPASRGRAPDLRWAVALGLGVGFAAAWIVRGAEQPVEPLRRFDIVLPDSAPLAAVGEATWGAGQTALALSRDGAWLAWSGGSAARPLLYLRNLRDGSTRALAGTEGGIQPFFSPDGQWIGFFADAQLKKVSVRSGQVVALAAAPASYGGDWGPNGEIVANIEDGNALVLYPEGGGSRRPAPGDTGQSAWWPVFFPQYLPGGTHVLGGCGVANACVRSLETGVQHFITRDGPTTIPRSGGSAIRGTAFRYVSSGHLIFMRQGDGNLAALPFDPETFEVSGDEVQLMNGIRVEGPLTEAMQVAVSDEGTLVWAPGHDSRVSVFVWADGAGRLDTLPFPPAMYHDFDLSEDGRWLAAVTVGTTGDREVRMMDLEQSATFTWRDPAYQVAWLTWDRRAQTLLLNTAMPGGTVLRIRRGAPSGGDTLAREKGLLAHTVLDDTTVIALRRMPTDEGQRFVWQGVAIPIAAASGTAELDRARPVVEDGGAHLFYAPSPDRRWILFTSSAGGNFEVYAVRHPAGGTPIRISAGGGELGEWDASGRRVYYRRGDTWFRVDRTGDQNQPFSRPQLFLRGDYQNVPGRDHAVSPDGERLLLLQGPDQPEIRVLHVMTGWFAELERRVGAGR